VRFPDRASKSTSKPWPPEGQVSPSPKKSPLPRGACGEGCHGPRPPPLLHFKVPGRVPGPFFPVGCFPLFFRPPDAPQTKWICFFPPQHQFWGAVFFPTPTPCSFLGVPRVLGKPPTRGFRVSAFLHPPVTPQFSDVLPPFFFFPPHKFSEVHTWPAQGIRRLRDLLFISFVCLFPN